MPGILKLINSHASGKKTLLFFIIANLIYTFMLLITIPGTVQFSGDTKILDMMPGGYDAEYVTNLFDALGRDGRAYYLYRQIPLDMVYPLFFAICYALIMAYFLKKLNRMDSALSYLCLLPLIAGLADYAENIGIITLLSSYPDLSAKIISATAMFSVTKSVSTTIYFILLIIILVILGYKTLTRRSA